ncbi:DNA methyltransferase, partial [Gemella sp. zg-1178]|uniref:DNA methyltransferase n=1 Tax=Gemella sp. zg-1178 TaxID=2840372 RepID=UPI00207B35C7
MNCIKNSSETDPPYNTGNKDFIYNDSFVDKTDGYSHSKWLSFMQQRLEIARELLSDEGVIFISIDDNEQAQLKLLCDEVFGEENYVGHFIWVRKKKGSFLNKKIRKMTEYVLCYTSNERI